LSFFAKFSKNPEIGSRKEEERDAKSKSILLFNLRRQGGKLNAPWVK
jgi:hypothetical protein